MARALEERLHLGHGVGPQRDIDVLRARFLEREAHVLAAPWMPGQ
jgi:hypothetical protein